MRQLVKPGAPKGDSSGRSRRPAVGPKAKEKPAAASGHRRLCFLAVLAATIFLWYRFSLLDDDGLRTGHAKGDADPCQGRYIYVCKLPPRFNTDIIRDACRDTDAGSERLCASVGNAGLGRPLADPADGVLTGENGWHGTRQVALDVIFHNRMKRYECLANRSTVATAIFVPFYASLDFARHADAAGRDNATRDAAAADVADWLRWRPEWDRRADGHDHFLVAGRAARDLMRDGSGPDWGTNLLVTPAGRNMSALVLESSLHEATSGFAVPYPTYFHPRTDADVFRWQERVRGLRRRWLMAFVGGETRQAPDSAATINDHVMAQCKASDSCGHLKLGRCAAGSTSQCHSPVNVMRLLQNATFCLHPPPGGDSYTRRWAFDSMVAGCIPVFFHPASAYLQYTWHLPKDYTKYSVLVPEAGVRASTVSIEATLRAIPAATVARMREEVVRLIPTVVYADPTAKLETVKDAFDIAVEGILHILARPRA
ncbi:hypothetical protein ACQ4PT_006371 [Festuca glaucescens]